MECIFKGSIDFKQCLDAHGLADDMDMDSDSGKSEFDEEYYQQRIPLGSDIEENTILIKADQSRPELSQLATVRCDTHVNFTSKCQLNQYEVLESAPSAFLNDEEKEHHGEPMSQSANIVEQLANGMPEDRSAGLESEGVWQTINHKRARNRSGKCNYKPLNVVQSITTQKITVAEKIVIKQYEEVPLFNCTSVELEDQSVHNPPFSDEEILLDIGATHITFTIENTIVDNNKPSSKKSTNDKALLNTSDKQKDNKLVCRIEMNDFEGADDSCEQYCEVSNSSVKQPVDNKSVGLNVTLLDTETDSKTDKQNDERDEDHDESSQIVETMLSVAVTADEDISEKQKLSKSQKRRRRKRESKNATLSANTAETDAEIVDDGKLILESAKSPLAFINGGFVDIIENNFIHNGLKGNGEILPHKCGAPSNATGDSGRVMGWCLDGQPFAILPNEDPVNCKKSTVNVKDVKEAMSESKRDVFMPRNGMLGAIPKLKTQEQTADNRKNKGKLLEEDRSVTGLDGATVDEVDKTLCEDLPLNGGSGKTGRKARRRNRKSESSQPGQELPQPPVQKSKFGMPDHSALMGGEYLWQRIDKFFSNIDTQMASSCLRNYRPQTCGHNAPAAGGMNENTRKKHKGKKNKKSTAETDSANAPDSMKMLIEYSTSVFERHLAPWMSLAAKIESTLGKIIEGDSVFPSDKCTHYLAVIDGEAGKCLPMYQVHDFNRDCLRLYTKNMDLIREAVESDLFDLTLEMDAFSSDPRTLRYQFPDGTRLVPVRLGQLLKCDALCVGQRRLQLKVYTVFSERVFSEVMNAPMNFTRRVLYRKAWQVPVVTRKP